jgi:mono/diheme cytochrome c family protein
MHPFFKTIGPQLLAVFLLLLPSVYSYAEDSGEQLFKEHCASCHEMGRLLTGPDLYKINEKRTRDWLHDFIKNSQGMIESGDELAIALFEEYQRVEMPPADLSDDEIQRVINYIASFEFTDKNSIAVNTAKDKKTNKPFFIDIYYIIIGIMFLGICAFFFYKRHISKHVALSFFIILSCLFVFLFLFKFVKDVRQKKFNPTLCEQEIEFDHALHYNEYEIDCIYCHEKAINLKKANLPGISLCMKCHDYIRDGEKNGKDEIKKILQYAESNQRIAWEKAYRLAEHIHFDHSLHKQAAKLNCLDCHTNTGNPCIRKKDISMQWCIDCHSRSAIFSELNYYKAIYSIEERKENIPLKKNGGINCMTCHY